MLTNAELDHHATYSSRRDVEATFREFLGAAEHAVVWDRPELVALAKRQVPGGPRVWPFGARPSCRRAGRPFRLTASTSSCPSPAPTTRSTPPPR